MSTNSRSGYPRSPRSQANEAIRAFVRSRGDKPWTQADLAELDRLRAAWRTASVRPGTSLRSGMLTAA